MQNPVSPELKLKPELIRQRFDKINKKRIQITIEILQHRQKEFFEILPLLFHYNDKSFPGYVSDKTPAGISQYSPMQPAISAAKHLIPGYRHTRKAMRQMDIHSLFFMGSCGTIAYTQKSDFDVWLIHDENLGPEQIEELAEKAAKIEAWADEQLRLEVHFFIFDEKSFQAGQHESLSTESSGSTQHYLLLDEFYRSSLLLAGRYPIWWLIPPDRENHYDDYVDMLLQEGTVDKADVVNLGKASPVPANEFFGAAVWQLYKSISSPHKSVLKLLLMEVYASEHPHIDLLSTCYKRYIYEDRQNLSDLDPYIIMYRKVEEYLMIKNDRFRLDIFRSCFYFKIGEKLSKHIKTENKNWRRRTVEDLMLAWGWDDANFQLLDMYESWKIDNVSTERNRLVKTLTESYRFLSDFARRHADVYRVSQTELNVLGRKLYAAFDKKVGKVEIINYNSQCDLNESEVTIKLASGKNGKQSWSLYRGRIMNERLNEYHPLKRTGNLMELLTWSHLNRILTPHSAITLHTANHGITAREIKDTFHALEKLFPSGKLYEPDFNDLSQAARITSAGIFVNLGMDPLGKNAENGKLIASDRIDALSYGAQHQNLALCFDLILITSWEEVMVYHYEGLPGLMKCLCDYLSWSPKQSLLSSDSLQVYSLSSSYGRSIAMRIKQLFKDILRCSHPKNRKGKDLKYIIESEDNFYVLEIINDKAEFRSSYSREALMHYLSQPVENFSVVYFDHNDITQSSLPQVYKLNLESVIQVFFETMGRKVHVTVLDEKGSCFSHIMPFYNTQTLISHFSQFFLSILNRKYFMSDEMIDINSVGLEFYEVRNVGKNKYDITKINVKPNPFSKSFYNVKVLGSTNENEENALTVYCNNQEFSSLEYGQDVLTVVAENILAQRKSGQDYPIYITDIDFSRGILDVIDPKDLQSIHFLNYKKTVEEKLNNAIQNTSRRISAESIR